MDASALFILISIVTFAAIAALWFFVIRPHGGQPLSPLSGLAFAFIIVGTIVGSDPQWLGYGLLAIGVLLAVADIVFRQQDRRRG